MNEARSGTDVYAIVLGRPDEPSSQSVNGVKVTRIPVNSGRTLTGITSFIQSVLDYVKTEYFDLVHVYPFSGAFLLPLLGRRISKAKWIYNIRSGPISSGIKRRLENLSPILRQVLFFDAVFIISESVARSIFGTMKPNFYIAPLGVNLEKFNPVGNSKIRERLGYSNNDFIFIYSGVLDKRRRLDTLLYALKQAQVKCPQLKLVLIGNGPDKLNLINLAKDLSIVDRVVFEGYVPYQSVPAYLSAADMGVSYLPIESGYYIQPPLKVAEYLGCGLPVIATNTEGHQYFIQDCFNGLLIDDTPEALANDAFIRIARDQTLLNQIQNHARSSVLEHSWQKIVDTHLLPAYQKILNS
ncbi:MAG: glycosyltransferase family 4 protein [Anaerolineae bacterium]|nr:glycosyltransferase family 4 protein [Anaerolineae bacterium]